MSKTRFGTVLVGLASMGLFVACSSPTATPVPPTATATAVPATPTATRPVTPSVIATPTAVAPTVPPTPTPTRLPTPTPTPTPTPIPTRAEVIVFSNSAPHLVVIDAATERVVRQATIPEFTAWTYTDDSNYYDGKLLWVGMRVAAAGPNQHDAFLVSLDLDKLEIVDKIPLGKETSTLYLGHATPEGILPVAKHAAWQTLMVDLKSKQVVNTWDVPTQTKKTGVAPAFAACDADTYLASDKVQRIYIPTSQGETTVALDAKTGQVLKIFEHPAASRPCMLTVGYDGMIWVQECDSNTNTVHDPITLELKARFQTGVGPLLASFTPDQKYAIIANRDNTVTIVDNKTYQVVKSIDTGNQSSITGVHPNSRFLYVGNNREAQVTVADLTTMTVTKKIPVGTNPSGLFVRPLP